MPVRDDYSTPRFPIRIAARRGGISVAALRAWERRYGAVAPARTNGEQRLYSENDVGRIALLRQLTDAGNAISAIAAVSTDELRRLWSSLASADPAVSPSRAPAETTAPIDAPSTQLVVRACLRAVHAHDAERVYRVLQREALRLTTLAFLEGVAAPLMQRVGNEWATGHLTEAQERIASGALRRVLGVLLQYLPIDQRDRPRAERPPVRILAATLAGERHEIGVLMAAAVAAEVGCDVSYPGADLPAKALATAARQAHADIVALSLLDGSAPRLAQRELMTLRQMLPARTRIVVGGASAALLEDGLEPLGAQRVDSLSEWHRLLRDRSRMRGDGRA